MIHKAITVCQPWAWAIFGPKRFENRRWKTDYRGPLLIHAGKSTEWMEPGLAALKRLGITPPAELPMGAIVGRVELVDCLPVREFPRDPFASGPICWCLARPRRLLTPIPYKGAQGLFGVPDRVLAAAEWEPACRICGCTEWRPCPGGCFWSNLEKDICSACSGIAELCESARAERIHTTCGCGLPLLILIAGGELGIYAKRPAVDQAWKRTTHCPNCKRSFKGATIDQVKGGIWQS